MRPVDGVAGLETNDALPTALRKLLARLGWSEAILRESLRLQCKNTHRATKQDILLLVDVLHAWMGLLGCAIDFAGLVLFVVAKLFVNGHDGLQRTLFVDQRDLRALFDMCSLF